MLQSLTPRIVFAALAALSAASMAFAVLFLQRHLNLTPCPLCMTQRVFVVAWGACALLAVIHHPRSWGNRVYAALCSLWSLLGGAVAARHVWLQHLPKDQVPACGPSLEYMLQTLPLGETFKLILMGDGNCADTLWTFLGFSIPEQTLAVFLVATLIGLWQTFRRYPQGG